MTDIRSRHVPCEDGTGSGHDVLRLRADVAL